MDITPCFSAASILRCASSTQIQSGVLVIPTGLELVFSTALIFTNWGSGWHHLLLAAEGYVYFVLTILDLLLHVLPSVRDHLPVFEGVDRFLASTSSIPLFLYTTFVFLFTRKELINVLPKKFQYVVQTTLLCFIPAIVVTNELGSFLGVQYRSSRPVRIGFRNNSAFTLWSFFTNTTLTLLTSYQALTFSLAFYRLIRALISQRSKEESDTSYRFGDPRYGYGEQGISANEDKIILYKGTAWVTGGLKLGAIETVVGFVTTGGFGVALVRRILRMLSRAFIIIGLAKGLDVVEDFGDVRNEIMRNKEARQRHQPMLSINPRYSTFRQLSPSASSFRPLPDTSILNAVPRNAPTSRYLYNNPIPPSQYKTPRVLRKKSSPYNTPLPTPTSLPPEPQPTMEEFTRLRASENSKRVTVRKMESGVPTLLMRLSGEWIPSPQEITESIASRAISPSDLVRYYRGGTERPPVSIVYSDSSGNLQDDNHRPRPSTDDLMSRLSFSNPPTPSRATSYNISSPPPLPSPSIIQNPPYSSSHASTVFSFLPPPPPSLTRGGGRGGEDPSFTPSLLLRRSLASPPPVARQQQLSRNDSALSDRLVKPWFNGQRHPYARAGSDDISVAGLPSRPQRTLTFGATSSEGGHYSSSDNEGGSSTRTLISHVNGVRTRSNAPSPSPLRPIKTDVEPNRVPESDTGHSDSTHSAYSQMTLRTSNSLKRKPPPPVSPTMLTVDTTVGRAVPGNAVSNAVNNHDRAPLDVPKSAFPESLNSAITPNPFGDDGITGVDVIVPHSDDGDGRYSAALNTGKSGDFNAMWKMKKRNSSLRRADSKRSDLSTHNEIDEFAVEELRERLQKDAMTIPWLRTPSNAKDFEFEIQKASRVQLPRIKSIGRAPRRSTPTPVRAQHARASMHMSIETVPPTASSLPTDNLLRNSKRMSFAAGGVMAKTAAEEYRDRVVRREYGRGVLRDSEVLAFEDDSPITGRNPFSRR